MKKYFENLDEALECLEICNVPEHLRKHIIKLVEFTHRLTSDQLKTLTLLEKLEKTSIFKQAHFLSLKKALFKRVKEITILANDISGIVDIDKDVSDILSKVEEKFKK